MSSSGPNFVFMAEFRLQCPISSSWPNFVFAVEFRLQGRISRPQRSIPEPRTLSNSVFGPNFVFRTNFVFTNEFRLQRAPNRISSSQDFRLHGRFSSSHFRLRARFELQLLANNFVFKSFGISASGGGRNRDPLSRVNVLTHAQKRTPGKC